VCTFNANPCATTLFFTEIPTDPIFKELIELSQFYKIKQLYEFLNSDKLDYIDYLHKDLVKLMKEVLQRRNLSDVTFLVDDTSFHLHKCILGCRSVWFEAFCVKGKFKETFQKVIRLNSISMEAFSVIIEYLYTSEVNTILDYEIAFEVLAKAHEWNLNELFKICEAILCDKLTTESQQESLIQLTSLSEIYFAEQLLKGCIISIAAHPEYNEIITSDNFKQLSLETRSKIIVEYKYQQQHLLLKSIIGEEIPVIYYKPPYSRTFWKVGRDPQYNFMIYSFVYL